MYIRIAVDREVFIYAWFLYFPETDFLLKEFFQSAVHCQTGTICTYTDVHKSSYIRAFRSNFLHLTLVNEINKKIPNEIFLSFRILAQESFTYEVEICKTM